MNEQLDIAWAAGLFEGEGCLTRPKYPTMQLTTTDRDVVMKFKRVVGCGKVYGPYNRKFKPIYQWVCYDREQIDRLRRLFAPYMGKRRLRRFAEVLD
jgi:hypothetical protein